jgi:DNA-directed RNA polymerase
MPNLIHSLDATALALLAKYLFGEDYKEVKNFYAVHDCFAVTANNVDSLIKYLKLVYLEMYSQDGYLRKLDLELIRDIKYAYGEDCFNDETRKINVNINDLEIKETFPNIDLVLGTKLPHPNELIKDSSYLIN